MVHYRKTLEIIKTIIKEAWLVIIDVVCSQDDYRAENCNSFDKIKKKNISTTVSSGQTFLRFQNHSEGFDILIIILIIYVPI